VEPLIGRALQPPPALSRLLDRTTRREELDADLPVLRERLLDA
jgi:hypothetical protein